MKKSFASITTIVGMRGCGKSTLTQALSKKHSRKIVFDFVQEWVGPYIYVENFDQFSNKFREVFNRNEYTIIIRFKFGTSHEDIEHIQTQIVNLVYLAGRDSELETCLIFEEAQFYFPNNKLHPINLHLLTTGRHAFINIIANTQRPASVHKLLISQSAEFYIGSLYEANDIGYLYDSLGDLAYQSRELQPMNFIYYPVGHPENISIIEL